MFNINYHNETGDIVSYNEGPADSLKTPEGCSTLHFSAPITGFQHTNGQLLMKVDVATGKLVLLNPVEIPEPLANVPNAEVK